MRVLHVGDCAAGVERRGLAVESSARAPGGADKLVDEKQPFCIVTHLLVSAHAGGIVKRLLGSFGAGLFVALAAAILLTRRSGIFGGVTRQAEQTANKVLRDAEQLADKMRDEFVPGKVNTGESSPGLLDLNACSFQDLLSIRGLDPTWVTRIVESRPYRSKMDLLSRMVVPMDIFTIISGRIRIGDPDEDVKIA
jgi:hypothetical protein